MPSNLKPSEIKQYTADRAVLEVDLCKALYEQYNKDPILGQIRETVALVFENVVAQLILPKMASEAVVKEGCKETKLEQVFSKQGKGPAKDAGALRQTCRAVLDHWHSWDAADCSDLTRFAGSVLEKAATSSAWQDFKSIHEAAKPDALFVNDPYSPGRSRDKRDSHRVLSDKERAGHIGVGREAGLARRINVMDRAGHVVDSGIDPFVLMPTSTVRKIDLAFGLPAGADISGTTSDSVIVNRLVSRFCAATDSETSASSRLLQLLPLVTMVSHGHHTLLESALSLTLNGFCSYQIGFYTSLLKRDPNDQRYDVDGIIQVLANFEGNRNNHHMLCWWDHDLKQYTGDLYTSPEEVKQYRHLATTSEGFLKFFRDRVHDMVFAADLEPLKAGTYAAAKRVIL